MDSARFDALARSVASSTSRRRVLAGLAGSALGILGLRTTEARTCSAIGTICREHATCCSGACGAADRTGRRRCTCSSASDCPTPRNPCATAVCTGGTCSERTAPDGIQCDVGKVCLDGLCRGNGQCPIDGPFVIGGCATNTCSVDGIGLSACISTTENAEVCVGSAALAGLCIACTTSDECPTGFICYPGSNRCADPGSCNPVCETTTTSLAAAVDDAASFNVHD